MWRQTCPWHILSKSSWESITAFVLSGFFFTISCNRFVKEIKVKVTSFRGQTSRGRCSFDLSGVDASRQHFRFSLQRLQEIRVVAICLVWWKSWKHDVMSVRRSGRGRVKMWGLLLSKLESGAILDLSRSCVSWCFFCSNSLIRWRRFVTARTWKRNIIIKKNL